MMSSSAPRPRVHRLRGLLAAVAATALVACHGEEGDGPKRIAGDYVREIDGRPTTQFYVRQVLTLRADGSWLRTTQVEAAGKPRESPPDSGTYRIDGVKLALRSLVEPAAAPMRYTLNGDSLFSANAAQVHALTGHDIGEEVLVRAP